jgi:hypothetical protein
MKRGEIKLRCSRNLHCLFFFLRQTAFHLELCAAARAHYIKLQSPLKSCALDAFAMMISSHIMQSDGFLLYWDDLYILCAHSSGINLVVSKTSARSLYVRNHGRFSLIIFPHLHHVRNSTTALLAARESYGPWTIAILHNTIWDGFHTLSQRKWCARCILMNWSKERVFPLLDSRRIILQFK